MSPSFLLELSKLNRSEMLVLFWHIDNQGAYNAKEIASACGISAPAARRALYSLIESELIWTVNDQYGGRVLSILHENIRDEIAPPSQEMLPHLNIPKSSPSFVVKAVYRALCLKYHPDRNTDKVEECTEKLKDITVAYEEYLKERTL